MLKLHDKFERGNFWKIKQTSKEFRHLIAALFLLKFIQEKHSEVAFAMTLFSANLVPSA